MTVDPGKSGSPRVELMGALVSVFGACQFLELDNQGEARKQLDLAVVHLAAFLDLKGLGELRPLLSGMDPREVAKAAPEPDDAAADAELEKMIGLAFEQILHAPTKEQRSTACAQLVALVRYRTPAQTARMEVELGILGKAPPA